MSHMENTGESSGITGMNNEHQDDVQSTPERLAKDPTAPFEEIHAVLVSTADPKKNELPGKPPNYLNEQELKGEGHGSLDLAAFLLRNVDPKNLIDIIFRRVAFLSNVGGCSHHRHRTSEYVPKVVKIIEKLPRGYRLDDIIYEEKDLIFLRQLLEHILDAKNVNASRPDAVLEALTAAPPCHSRANANLFASIS